MLASAAIQHSCCHCHSSSALLLLPKKSGVQNCRISSVSGKEKEKEKERERRGKQHVCGVAMNGFSALLSGGNSGRLARSDAPVEQQQQQQQEGNGGGGGGGGFDDFHVKGPSILVFSGERNFVVRGFSSGRGIGSNGSDGQCGFWECF
jgi:hypothetical protein